MDILPFNLKGSTIKALELLNEGLYTKTFTSNMVSSYEILIIYKVYLMYLENELYKIEDEDEFWEKFCEFIVTEAKGKIGIFTL